MWKPIFQTLQHLGGRSCFIFCFEFIIHVNSSFSLFWKFFPSLSRFQVIEQFLLFFQWKSSGLSIVLFTTGGLVRGVEQKRNLYIPVWSREKYLTKKRIQLYFCNHKNLASFTRFLLVFEPRSLRVTISLQFYSVLLFLFTANFTVTNSFPVTRHGFSKL